MRLGFFAFLGVLIAVLAVIYAGLRNSQSQSPRTCLRDNFYSVSNGAFSSDA